MLEMLLRVLLVSFQPSLPLFIQPLDPSPFVHAATNTANTTSTAIATATHVQTTLVEMKSCNIALIERRCGGVVCQRPVSESVMLVGGHKTAPAQNASGRLHGMCVHVRPCARLSFSLERFC